MSGFLAFLDIFSGRQMASKYRSMAFGEDDILIQPCHRLHKFDCTPYTPKPLSSGTELVSCELLTLGKMKPGLQLLDFILIYKDLKTCCH